MTRFPSRTVTLALFSAALLLPVLAPRSASATPSQTPPVVINELLAHTDPPQVDSVELYNPGPNPADISGWCLSDDDKQPCQFEFPLSTVIPADAYYVLELQQANDFGLSEMGETVTLRSATNRVLTGYAHAVKFGASPNGVSLGRVVTSDGRELFPLLEQTTLGAPNASPWVGPIVITEVMYHPVPGSTDVEYLELVNRSTSAVPLYDPANPRNRWRIEGVGSVTLPAIALAAGKSLFVTSVDPQTFRDLYSLPDSVLVIGPYSGNLADGGEQVSLQRPEPPNLDDREVPYVVEDEVTYNDEFPWPSKADGQGNAMARACWNCFGEFPESWISGASVAARRSVFLPVVQDH